MKRIALIIFALALSACTTLNVADPSQFMSSGTSSPGGMPSSGDASHKLGAVYPQQAGDFWVNQTAVTPFAIKDTGAVTRDTFETVHGVVKMGGGGTDFALSCGPLTGQETVYGACWSLPTGTSRSSANPLIYGDGSNAWLNSVGAAGLIGFTSAGSYVSKIAPASGTQYSFWLGQGAAFSSSNYALISDASTFTNTNFPSGGYFGITSANATYVAQFAGGTQAGQALGANISTVGHIRTPSGWVWQSRNSGNSANNTVMQDDGANNLSLSSGYATLALSATSQITLVTGGATIAIESGTDMYLDETALHLRNAAHTEFMSFTPAATSLFQFNATNATSGQISWTANAAGAGNTTSLVGNNAGGTNNGGDVQIISGLHAGAGTFDGALMLNSTPLGPGYVAFTPAGGANNLSTGQSDANVLVLNASAAAPITINFARAVTKQTCVWIRNNTSQTATIQFNGTSSATTLATLTGGMYCADGAALQRIMWLDPLDLPKPANDNDVQPLLEHSKAA